METIYNWRDFGGYRTQSGLMIKKRLLYRSGSLAGASDLDLQELPSLGIRTICDLRTHQEKSNWPDRISGNSPIRSIHIPVKVKSYTEPRSISLLFSLISGQARELDYDQVSREVYQEFVSDFRPEFSQVIKLVTERDNLPILIHCSGGKDRTGFACSLIQLLLGMPPELVMQDYLLSNDYLHEFKDRMLSRFKLFYILGMPRQKFLPLFEARRTYLEAAFAQMRSEYGSVEAFIREGLGIADEDRLALNDLLLEKVT